MSEILKALGKPFPRDVVRTRDGGGGKKLSYLPGHVVIQRLNEATGETGWSWSILDIHYEENLLVCRGALTIPGLGSREGIGVQMVRPNSGEDLLKGASTDALKKAATLFGVGLELYEDAPAFTAPQPRPQYQQRPNAPQAPRPTPRYPDRTGAAQASYDAPMSPPRQPAPVPAKQAVDDFLGDPDALFRADEVTKPARPTGAIAGGM